MLPTMSRKAIRITVAGIVVTILAAAALYRAFGYAAAVETVPVAEGAVPVTIKGPGTVEARFPVTLSARITATITNLHVDQGDAVKRGQLVATLDDRDLAAKRAGSVQTQETARRNVTAAQAAVAKAEAELDLARTKHRRDQDLLRAGYVSQSVMDASAATLRSAEANLENAKALLAAREADTGTVAQEAAYAAAVLSHTQLAAPIDGIIIERLVETGSTVVAGTPIFRMVDPATLWVAARIDESVVGRVSVGMPAAIRLRTGETVSGKVARISRQGDAATRELEVNVAFDAPLSRFAIDQEAEVAIAAGEERGLVVPIASLVENAGKQGALVIEDGRARFRPLATGAADGKRIVVRKGLAAGDVVIADPQRVKPGSRVKPAGG
jgi:RND family efflux transporter MFP subunit